MTNISSSVNTSEGMTSVSGFGTTTTVGGVTMTMGGVTMVAPTDDPEYGHGFHGNTGDESTTDDMYYHQEYDIFIYPGYSFERPVYMYIWGIFVIITFLANILVISVLVRKKMRNPTNMILAAIAISDSLTGLVTLPTYWMVYSKSLMSEMSHEYYDSDFSETTTVIHGNETESVQLNDTMPHQNYDYDYNMHPENNTYYDSMHPENSSNLDSMHPDYDYEVRDGYELSQSLCRGFMISKYFLSKMFHTISIWMTLFLGFQRFISVASPFRAQKFFSERNVIVTCVVIAVLAPVLHVYHLLDEKANSEVGMCQWDIEEDCAGGCAYLVTAFLLRHFIPCVLLVIFTALFVTQLAKSSSRLSRIDSNRGNTAMKHRDSENRRVSLIVTLIVVVFLIPEVPYGGFLLYALIGKLQHVQFDLETNRAIHLAYEISLVLSFHANVYIYTFFNKRFRKGLIRGIVYPIITCCDTFSCFGLRALRDKWSRMSFSSGTRRGTRQSETTGTRIEMGNIRRNSSSAGRTTTVTEASRFIDNGNSHIEHGYSTEKSQCLPQENVTDVKM